MELGSLQFEGFEYLVPEEIEMSSYFVIDEVFLGGTEPKTLEVGGFNLFHLLPFWVLRNKVLEESPRKFTLVDGYKRFNSLKKIYQEDSPLKLPCLVFSADSSREKLLVVKILFKASTTTLGLLDKACSVKRLSEIYQPWEIKEKFFPLLGIPPKPGLYRLLLNISEAQALFKRALALEIVSDKTALVLARWKEKDYTACIEMLESLRPSVSVQKEIVESIEDISRLKECSPETVIRNEYITFILKNEKLNHAEKTEKVRKILRSWLYPHLVRRESKFKTNLKNLNMPYGIAFNPPRNFEGDTWEMRVVFSSAEDFSGKIRQLADKIKLPLFKELFSGLQGS